MRNIAHEVQAAGVVAAHSGTYIGVLIDALGAQHDTQVRRASAMIAGLGLTPMVFRSIEARTSQLSSHVVSS
jgi:uncharacterized protein involved in propanediol utilization